MVALRQSVSVPMDGRVVECPDVLGSTLPGDTVNDII